MDKIKRYQKIIIDYLKEYAKVKPSNLPNIESRVIIDKKNNHFQLLDWGWQDNEYIFTVVFHFDIINDKVWFQRNITEREVVDVFMEKGIPKEDIVLGFRSPKIRPYTGFATA